jgi:hypothetical protein
MDEHQVRKIVSEALARPQSAGVGYQVLAEGIRQDGDWWYVPVARQPRADGIYQYYEDLTRAEDYIEAQHQVHVLLVPAA